MKLTLSAAVHSYDSHLPAPTRHTSSATYTTRASPRDLSIYAHRPTEYEELVDSQVRRMRPEILQDIFQTPESGTTFHLVVVMEPSPNSRSVCWKRFASRRTFEILWDCHIKHRVTNMRLYYDLLQRCPGMTSLLSWIFELRMHERLGQGYPILLTPFCDHRGGLCLQRPRHP